MSSVRGEVVTETLEYDGGRQVSVFVPAVPPDAIVFAADGGWHIERLSEALEGADALPTMVVGVHGLQDDEARLYECVPGFDQERFEAHEEFFVEEVRGWVQSRFGFSLPAERTGVWGASLGGELSLALGHRHPDVFGASFCCSPGGGYKPSGSLPSPLPRTYLVAGTKEPFFLQNATRWAQALQEAGADVRMEERDGDHGDPFWAEEFPSMVAWAFGS